MSNPPGLTYEFSYTELTLLAKFFRIHKKELPSGLEDFFSVAENYIYDTMTIEEAESLLHENN
ncbi:MAG: hypothetical protein R3Y36_03720 [Spirochaetales bacterium]